jgi:hypothetical protein
MTGAPALIKKEQWAGVPRPILFSLPAALTLTAMPAGSRLVLGDRSEDHHAPQIHHSVDLGIEWRLGNVSLAALVTQGFQRHMEQVRIASLRRTAVGVDLRVGGLMVAVPVWPFRMSTHSTSCSFSRIWSLMID